MALVDLINQVSTDQPAAQSRKSEPGMDDLLQLLAARLKNQEPSDPLKNQDFITQLAQFTSLELMVKLNRNLEQMNYLHSLTQAAAFIGKKVFWYDAGGAKQDGIVSSVGVVNGLPTLTVGDKQVSVSGIFAIAGGT